MKTDTRVRLRSLLEAIDQAEPILESLPLRSAIEHFLRDPAPEIQRRLLDAMHRFASERFDTSPTGRHVLRMCPYLAACFGCAQALVWRDTIEQIEGIELRDTLRRAAEIPVELSGDFPRPHGVPGAQPVLPDDFDRAKIPAPILDAIMAGEPLCREHLDELLAIEVGELERELECGWDVLLKAARADALPDTPLAQSVRALVLMIDREDGRAEG